MYLYMYLHITYLYVNINGYFVNYVFYTRDIWMPPWINAYTYAQFIIQTYCTFKMKNYFT